MHVLGSRLAAALIHAINAIGSAHPPRGLFEPERLLAEAERVTGLSVWGSDDFGAPLRVLLRDLEEMAALHRLGRLWWRHRLLALLVTRLLIEDYVRQNPASQQVTIDKPLFIMGLARTGTTLLQRLLAQDPSSRWLTVGQMLWPVPKRITLRPPALLRGSGFEAYYHRRMSAIHLITDDAPGEDVILFQRTFVNPQFQLLAYLPRYTEWLSEPRDFTGALAYYRKELQILHHLRPGHHWILKNPGYPYYGASLVKAFPGARFIHTHRDVTTSLASTCSLVETSRRTFSNRVLERKTFGQAMLSRLEFNLERTAAMRAAARPEQFFDVQYDELVREPMRVVRSIYTWLGYPLPEETAKRMEAWLVADRKSRKREKHRYDPEVFGISAAEIEKRLAGRPC